MTKVTPRIEAGFGICPHCGKNYFIKQLANAKSGIKYTLTCASNRSTLTCRESETVFLEDLKYVVLELIAVLKSKPQELKKVLKNALYIDEKPIRFKIESINEEINLLRSRVQSLNGKLGDCYTAIRDEIESNIENLMTEKKALENNLLTQLDYDSKIKEITTALDSLS